MELKKRQQMQERIKFDILKIFRKHLLDIDFYYYRGGRTLFVTYEDFKPEQHARQLLKRVVTGKWNIVIRREFSSKNIMNTMLDMYRQNRVAVVDMVNNELVPFEIRDYVNGRMATK